MILSDATPALAPSAGPSAPPRPAAGTRARAGNAMARTRSAVLAGALRAVEQSGVRRATMADVAVLGGVAKATVYNHFRAKADVLAALVESEVQALGDECLERAGGPAGRDGLAGALEHASVRLSEHRALRRLADGEPEVLARLLAPGDGWAQARVAARQVLRATGRAGEDAEVDAVLRLLVSHLAWPAGRAEAAVAADALARGLAPTAQPGTGTGAGGVPAAAGDAAAGSPPAPGSAASGSSGLGWPT